MIKADLEQELSDLREKITAQNAELLQYAKMLGKRGQLISELKKRIKALKGVQL